MDFTKFVAMLESQCLYFARADLLGDPFEGSYSRANERFRQERYGMSAASFELFNLGFSSLSNRLRYWTFVSCWHMNESESAAMWRLYAQSNESVALRTSYSKLRDQLTPRAYVGVVDYIDFEKDWLPEGNTFYPYLHKRKSFQHEREVRAIIQEPPEKDGALDLSMQPVECGVRHPIQLAELLEVVYVAPTCQSWFAQLVRDTCARHGIALPVVQSALDAKPFF